MENSTTHQEIIGLEKKYWKAMIDKDLKTALELTDFPCLVAGAQGLHSVDRDSFKKMFESNDGRIKDFRFDENPEVRLLNDDCAVLAYKIKSTMSVGGKDQPCDAIDTSTWVKRDGQWVCAMHAEIDVGKKH